MRALFRALSNFTNAVGGIADFRSMSFIRMYLTNFSAPVLLRFASLDLVRGDWRVYQGALQTDPLNTPLEIGTQLEVNTVNVEENSTRVPIAYALPPGAEESEQWAMVCPHKYQLVNSALCGFRSSRCGDAVTSNGGSNRIEQIHFYRVAFFRSSGTC